MSMAREEERTLRVALEERLSKAFKDCLLYTSDAADE